jgi:hypothetical protein
MGLAGMIEPVDPAAARLAPEMASLRLGTARVAAPNDVLPRLALWLADVSAEAALTSIREPAPPHDPANTRLIPE